MSLRPATKALEHHSDGRPSSRGRNILENSPNLDYLRCIAVTYVVIDHGLRFFGHTYVLGLNVNWLGLLGVMFFFVHTCAVLMLSQQRMKGHASETDRTLAFYVRRIFRIYPLSIFAILVVLTFQIPSQDIAARFRLDSFHPSWSELTANLLLIQNVWPHNSRQIIGVLWSLPYEVQMYLLLPALFYFQRKIKTIWPLFGVWGFSWLLAHFVPPLVYAPHFVAGVVAYYLASRNRFHLWPAWTLPALLPVLTAIFYINHTRWLGAIVCIVLGFCLPRIAHLKNAWLNKTTYNIAKYSYGVYLSHLFCLWFSFDKVPLLQWPCFIVLLIGLPVALFHLIESPMIKVGINIGNHFVKVPTSDTLVDSMAKTAP